MFFLVFLFKFFFFFIFSLDKTSFMFELLLSPGAVACRGLTAQLMCCGRERVSFEC